MTDRKHIRIVPRDEQLFGGTRTALCKACGKSHMARDMPIGLCRECIAHIVTETPAAKRRAAMPTNEERADWYRAHRTDVPREMRRLPVADRAFLAFLRCVAWVGKKLGRKRG